MSTALRPPILRLDAETQSRIAAGEVVTRPVAALKELVENSLDAGARRIVVTVAGSLSEEFAVADDGRGIPRHEIPLALEAHATSKLRALGDLESLATLGFRGEALPSIARVSRLTLETRAEEESEGSRIEVTGGEAGVIGAAGRATGTTVTVRDLFFHLPARRKFQRTAAGELRAAARLLSACALAFPEVAFRFVVDGRERLSAPVAGSLGERIAAVLGRRFLEQCLEVREERPGVTLEAYAGVPELARLTREGQVLLVNRRWIASPTLSQALRHAYGNLLPPARHPSAVLDLRLDPASLDVNVHPAKTEVRFAHEDLVFHFVAQAVARPLAKLAPRYAPTGTTLERPPALEELIGHRGPQIGLWSGAPSAGAAPRVEIGGASVARDAAPAAPGDTPEAAPPARLVNLWQLHDTYVLAPVAGGLLIVDQHAAHERILYEEALDRMRRQAATSQQLLFPRIVDLTRAEFDLVVELVDPLSRLGFDLAPISPPTVVLRGAPPGLGDRDPGRLLQDVLDGMGEDRAADRPEDELTDRLAKSFACHAAVRAGDRLTLEEMNGLIDRLFATSLPHGDPHGRPAFVRVELGELNARFGRSGPSH